MTIEELRAIPLLQGASDSALERVANSAGEMTCEAGQVLALQGDRGSGMFVILDGSVSVEWRGGTVELEAGDFFGELTLLAPGGTRIARVRASSHVMCLAIPRDEALALVESEPSVALAMLKEIARRFASALPDA
ncbi:MAG: cyclic nucleotide-binding domain-containing protein [Thermoleophilia bacterium]|nr:cyclic nucleotide-binding domain-containing protein [Thermoleophilia bacterium]MDH4339161.1 cyclic nucleotide-binding domain-containing protein [Thermoleophilia bacterium]MDH5280714.1 cyclic nucleotide-binding domain-containing protein [Thermoleophilia bacterium]